MKKTVGFNKLLYLLNIVLALLLLFAYILPYISPTRLPRLAVLSLTVPLLVLLNFIFVIYWLVKLKIQLLLSALILGIGWWVSTPVYNFSDEKEPVKNDVKIMSYNVRMFNFYKWNKDVNLAKKTVAFIDSINPDILSIQEFYHDPTINFSLPYSYIKTRSKSTKFGQAIYSRFPIVNSGSLDLKNTTNNIIFADIVKNNDTIRIYNIHLQSFNIHPDKEYFGEPNSEKLFARFKSTFKTQAEQAKIFLKHQKSWKGKEIICGDFNNTAFSWVYKQISQGKKDAFLEVGNGFGKSFNYAFPMRIDFILTSQNIEINHFTIFEENFSDHYPILARINLK